MNLFQAVIQTAYFSLKVPECKSFMQELKPDTLEDVIAGIALYRPN